jgi:hypothetical protein
VASDVGGQAELVTPECGVLVPPTSFKADVAAYADALQRLLQDRGLAMELGRAGRARVCEHFRLVAMVDALERAVGEAAHLHQQSPRALPSPERALELVRPALALLEQRDELLDPTATGDPLWGTGLRTDWRARTYRVLHRWHEPVFHWYVGRGWTWMHPVRSALRTVLLRVVGVR